VSLHIVFGGLAIMVTEVTLDPLALRPRLSPGLPLSNEKTDMDTFWKKTKSLGNPGLRKEKIIFGGLAIIVTGVTLDPLALRPRLSPGLPYSDVFFKSYSKAFSMFSPYILVIHRLQLCKWEDGNSFA
jgi:hypothetical protein